MRLLVLSDIHGHDARLKEILSACPGRDGIVFIGDLQRRWNAGAADSLLGLLRTGSGKLLAVAGNMDAPALTAIFAGENASLHGSGSTVGDTGFFGVGGSNPTPFHSPFELSEEEIGRLLETGYARIGGAARKIMVSHVPPADCGLDRTSLGIHAGSTAVRRFLKEHSVDLCLCGHIHEAVGEESVAGVRCVNVGAVQDGAYAWLEIEKDKIFVTRRNIRSRM